MVFLGGRTDFARIELQTIKSQPVIVGNRHETNSRLRKHQRPLQTADFWIFGLLSVMMAVLKLTVAPYWSWSRVMLPMLAFLGHHALYIVTGLICFRWLKDEEDESTTADEHGQESYGIAGLLFFFLFFG